ncbi:MAG: hypothetical protein CMJ64_30330 [Planctomycetaceae bacterium]|nr:hypothetical protein [Planctomycetaceae bacterium]
MNNHSRRRFLSDVGKGMLVAGIGSNLAMELGISNALANDDANALTFGSLEPLVDLMQQIPVEKLQPALVHEIQRGTELKTLVAAGALANARHFAGHDYVGFHTMMALMPAWRIAEELPQTEQPLPVLKVLYRNTARIQEAGGDERLHTAEPAKLADTRRGGERLLKDMYKGDMQSAERTFAALSQGERSNAYNDLQHLVQDAPDVHRVTLAWRAWDTLQLLGYEHAHTLLRQSVRYCVEREQERLKKDRPEPALRKLTPRLLDDYKLLSKKTGLRKTDDAWVEQLAQTFFAATREQAAEAAAEALAEGFAPEDIGEAMSLAANLLILHDPGRPEKWASPEKPKDSVHGASVGVHASDSANSWRNIARVTNQRNLVCSLLVGAWHTAGQTGYITDSPFAFDVDVITSKKLDADALLAELNTAVQAKNQSKAMAVVKSWEIAGNPAKPIFDCLRRYAVSEDGALHAEKYFRTVTEEFTTTRPEFRWRHLIGLARVSASEYGWPAPGRDQARDLLET